MVAMAMMVGVRLLGKTARFHYLEREHLVQFLTLQRRFFTVTDNGHSPDMGSKAELQRLLDEAIRISGSVETEFLPPEIVAFRWLGFSPVVDLPVDNLVFLRKVRAVVEAEKGDGITASTAERVKEDMTTSLCLSNSFAPRMAGATETVKALVAGLNLVGIAVVLATFVLIRRSTPRDAWPMAICPAGQSSGRQPCNRLWAS